MARYCTGCVTLKTDGAACICRVMYDIDHLPYSLHQLTREDAKVDDLIQRLRSVLSQLTD